MGFTCESGDVGNEKYRVEKRKEAKREAVLIGALHWCRLKTVLNSSARLLFASVECAADRQAGSKQPVVGNHLRELTVALN